MLKANNYSLEAGESSVWDAEAEKAAPPPKKPMTAYMCFSRRYREANFPPPDPDAKGRSKKRKVGVRVKVGCRAPSSASLVAPRGL